MPRPARRRGSTFGCKTRETRFFVQNPKPRRANGAFACFCRVKSMSAGSRGEPQIPSPPAADDGENRQTTGGRTWATSRGVSCEREAGGGGASFRVDVVCPKSWPYFDKNRWPISLADSLAEAPRRGRTRGGRLWERFTDAPQALFGLFGPSGAEDCSHRWSAAKPVENVA